MEFYQMRHDSIEILLCDIQEITHDIQVAISLWQIERAQDLVEMRSTLIEALDAAAQACDIKPTQRMLDLLASVVLEIDKVKKCGSANRAEFVTRKNALQTYGSQAA